MNAIAGFRERARSRQARKAAANDRYITNAGLRVVASAMGSVEVIRMHSSVD